MNNTFLSSFLSFLWRTVYPSSSVLLSFSFSLPLFLLVSEKVLQRERKKDSKLFFETRDKRRSNLKFSLCIQITHKLTEREKERERNITLSHSSVFSPFSFFSHREKYFPYSVVCTWGVSFSMIRSCRMRGGRKREIREREKG